MKESKAQGLLCPFIQSGKISESFNTNLPLNINCVTAQCMAWARDTFPKDEKDPNGYCLRLSQ